MTTYHERVWPAKWIPWALLLVIPASLLVLLPVSWIAGVGTGVILYVACLALWFAAAGTLELRDGMLSAGRATIDVGFLGEAHALYAEDAFAARGRDLDPRAWLMIRGGVKDVVRVPVTDEDDPTPYWLLSTRSAHELAAAINDARRPAASFESE
ncbi:DUF3093 domain-containing protein [Paramicrobacterium agarici]|uniref:DUF3093 family protein n=1 Tax=Paramicrobacterium agarici TaxID=630514 RepID=A0A2A9DZB5_9MICO|nr:DUF3093 domain-containing protein [Microbacterium agarici]PFG31270.1 Protein of unknown function (DUF3093) [Microbacterium agarici]TQO24372.1 DUF3093 family protein [Microbacterium agarici]